jgi:hypothetical protein
VAHIRQSRPDAGLGLTHIRQSRPDDGIGYTHIRQSMPDAGLGFKAEVRKTLKDVPFRSKLFLSVLKAEVRHHTPLLSGMQTS